MTPFMGADFLLTTEPARQLYHDYAAALPIFDYHCHLSPEAIASDRRYASISEIWLGGDHYKWRAMRAAGVAERFVTGDAPDREKFQRWAATVPATLGNPLHHWTHLELRRYFRIETLLDARSAEAIWQRTNELLADDDFSTRRLLERMNVRYVGTTDDPVDDLAAHRMLASQGYPIVVRPSFRPDKAYNLTDPARFAAWLTQLAQAAGTEPITSFDRLTEALAKRIEYFAAAGCCTSDHALVDAVDAPATGSQLDAILTKALRGTVVDASEQEAFATAVLQFLVQQYAERNWVFQLHIGALRNVSRRRFEQLGPDTGFDAIGTTVRVDKLATFLDRAEHAGALPKTIVYSLNPNDNEVLAALMGSFQDGLTPGKMQHGSAWWFNDQLAGMSRQIISLANVGLIGRFIGMLTDSRSFLSFPRHEYFRRLLCEIVGGWIDRGEAPNEIAATGRMIQDIAWYNAVDYFNVAAVRREPT